MNVWKPGPAEGFEWALPVHPDRDYERLATMNGVSASATWEPIEVTLHRQNRSELFASADFPWCSKGVLVFRSAIIGFIEPAFPDFGEFLPLRCDEAELTLFNCTNVTDAFDVDHSELARYASTGRPHRVRRFGFRPWALRGADIFRIPQLTRVSTIFVSDRIRSLVSDHKLTGLEFELIWSEPNRVQP